MWRIILFWLGVRECLWKYTEFDHSLVFGIHSGHSLSWVGFWWLGQANRSEDYTLTGQSHNEVCTEYESIFRLGCLSVRLFVRNDVGRGSRFYRAKAGIETKNGVSMAEKRATGSV
jgi:hypothetical protein